MVIFSSLTNREAINLFGTLPIDRIEDLLDKSEKLEDICDVSRYVKEIIQNLNTVNTELRGNNLIFQTIDLVKQIERSIEK